MAIFDTECQKWPNLIRERALRSAIVAPRPPVQGLDSSSVARLARSRAPCMHLLTASCAGGWLPFSHARRTAPSATGADSRELAHGNCKRNSSSRRRRRVARTACGRRRRAQSRTPRARRRCRPTSLAVRRSPPPSAGELSAGGALGKARTLGCEACSLGFTPLLARSHFVRMLNSLEAALLGRSERARAVTSAGVA